MNLKIKVAALSSLILLYSNTAIAKSFVTGVGNISNTGTTGTTEAQQAQQVR